MSLICTSLFTDADGVSHFREVTLELHETRLGPGIPPLGATPSASAAAYYFLTFPPGISMDWHLAPQRLLHLFLAGECEVAVTDGEVRRFKVGDIVLAEDLTGQGHTTRNPGATETVMAVVVLTEETSTFL